MWCFERFVTICTILITWKTYMEECYLFSKIATFFRLYKWHQIAQSISYNLHFANAPFWSPVEILETSVVNGQNWSKSKTKGFRKTKDLKGSPPRNPTKKVTQSANLVNSIQQCWSGESFWIDQTTLTWNLSIND